MSKRYVFWRKPNGQPYRGNDGAYSPVEILAEYGLAAKVTPDDRVSWSGGVSYQFETALKSVAIVLGPDGEELNGKDSWNIVWSALVSTIKKGGGKKALKDSEVIKAADQEAAAFYRKPPSNYTLVSGLSVQSLPVQSARLMECQISSLSSRRHFPTPNCLRTYRTIDARVRSSKYQLIKVSTIGRSPDEAVCRALDALHLLRGVWSLFATYGSWSMSFGGKRWKPIGIIHAGPIHTLHHKNGTLIGDIFWHDDGVGEERDLFSPDTDTWKKIETNRRWAIGKIQKLLFRRDVEQLLVRYASALDQADHNIAFLQLWSILEKLTDSVGNYEETIRRTTWPFDNRPLAKQLLECMRLHRNLYVHSSKTSDSPDQPTYLIKEFVDAHLIRLIRNSFDAKSVEDYAQHLTLPSDVETLRSKKQLLEKAIRLMEKHA